jgi:hypothetical protein
MRATKTLKKGTYLVVSALQQLGGIWYENGTWFPTPTLDVFTRYR